MRHTFTSDPHAPRTVLPAPRARAPQDRHEREADATAARVISVEPNALSPQPVIPSIDTHAGSALADAPAGVADVLRTAGRPLDSTTRAFFEPRFGRGFAQVRVHDDAEAARSAHALSARAYTAGTHVVFGSGRHAPQTHSGRALIAHELTHVVQQGQDAAMTASSRVQCAPEAPSAYPVDELSQSVGIAVTTLPGESAHHSAVFKPGTRSVDLSSAALYSGDVFNLAATDTQGDAADTAALSLPAELEATSQSTPTRLQLRAIAGPAKGAAPVTVSLSVRIGSAPEPMDVTLSLRATPLQPDVTPQSMEGNAQALSDLKAERTRARRAHRALPGAERRAAREQRREERRDLRQQRRELLAQGDALEKQHGGCDLPDLRMIEDGLARAMTVSAAALARLGGTAGQDPVVKSALARYFMLSDALWPTQAQTVLTTVRDTLTTARNSLASASSTQFSCQGPASDCDDTTGAFVTQNSRGSPGNLVTLCPLWLSGTGLKFDPASGLPDARAYALLHEFVHLSGATTGGKEQYVSSGSWKHVSFAKAQKMADAYAAIAWMLGTGGHA